MTTEGGRMTASRCSVCRGVLDLCAQLNNCDVCTSCHLKAIHASRQGAHARVVAAIAARDQAVDEWAVFLAAVQQAAASSADGLVHQTAVRPLIAAIPPKHRGLLYRRARTEGLLREVGWEQSTDVAGRNGDKQQRIYEWKAVA